MYFSSICQFLLILSEIQQTRQTLFSGLGAYPDSSSTATLKCVYSEIKDIPCVSTAPAVASCRAGCEIKLKFQSSTYVTCHNANDNETFSHSDARLCDSDNYKNPTACYLISEQLEGISLVATPKENNCSYILMDGSKKSLFLYYGGWDSCSFTEFTVTTLEDGNCNLMNLKSGPIVYGIVILLSLLALSFGTFLLWKCKKIKSKRKSEEAGDCYDGRPKLQNPLNEEAPQHTSESPPTNASQSIHPEPDEASEAARKAEIEAEMALRLRETEHQLSIEALQDEGNAWAERGCYDKALEKYTQVKDACEAMGPDRLDTIQALQVIALHNEKFGKYSYARAAYQRLLELKASVSEAEHTKPATLNILNFIVQTFLKQQNYQRAREKLAEIYANFCETEKGGDDEEAMRALDAIADTYPADGANYEERRILRQILYESKCRIIGETHPETLQVLHSIATLYKLERNFSKERHVLFRIYDATLATKSPDHPAVLDTLEAVASSYIEDQLYEKARNEFTQLHAAYSRILRADALETINALKQIAYSHALEKNYEEAEATLQKALDSFPESSPARPDVVTDLCQLITRCRNLHIDSQPTDDEPLLATSASPSGSLVHTPAQSLTIDNPLPLADTLYADRTEPESRPRFQSLRRFLTCPRGCVSKSPTKSTESINMHIKGPRLA